MYFYIIVFSIAFLAQSKNFVSFLFHFLNMSSNPYPKTDESKEEEELGREALWLAFAGLLPMALKSALELGLIETICASDEGTFLSSSEIASRLPCVPRNPQAPDMLDRLMRLLASYSILRCRTVKAGENGNVDTERVYGAAPICRYLVKNEDSAPVGPLLSLVHDKFALESWYHLNDAILEGGSAFEKAHNNLRFFEYLATDQTRNRSFNEGMSSHSNLIVSRILRVYKGFEGLKVLVDVGGGTGATLSAITDKYPQIKGINFDLPYVLSDAPSYPGVEHVRGDMFASVPQGDAILLKWILHSWNDEDCLKILKNCWEALPSHGKVIIVESILPEQFGNDVCSKITVHLDLQMLVQFGGGKERTLKEFEALAAKSGFSSPQVVCSAYNLSIVEFHKIKNA